MIGRARNGQFAPAAPANLADELAAVEAEMARVERAGLPLDHLIALAKAELRDCQTEFECYGFETRSVEPARRFELWRRTTIGALMVTNGAALVDSDLARVTREFEAAGGVGLSPSDKAARLSELRNRQRQLLARLEQSLRAQEGDGELVADPRRSAEFFLLPDSDLERIANGEATA